MSEKLKGKVAIVTGASAGIGEACARALAAEGAQIIVTARRKERLDALVTELQKSGVKTEFAIGTGRTVEGVAASGMLEASDVAGAVLLACTQSAGSRIIEIQMRTMSESLA
jgi:NADP-dependent 3-hydroxy acid dehydrogenase YdfG